MVVQDKATGKLLCEMFSPVTQVVDIGRNKYYLVHISFKRLACMRMQVIY